MPNSVVPAAEIAIIISSTRCPRLGPGIANYVHHVCFTKAQVANLDVQVELVDIAEQNLPIYDEPAIPSHLPKEDPTPNYLHQHTRLWSAKMRSYDAYIFVTPQYNWSVPASLKNALDYLFHEWAAKPVAIVTYGSKGGSRAANHLRDILNGLRMKPVSTDTALTIGDTVLEEYLRSGAIQSETLRSWDEAGVKHRLTQAFCEITEALQLV